MAELGRAGVDLHAEVGRLVASLKVDQLVTVGVLGAVTAAAARAAGLGRVLEFGEASAAAAAMGRLVREGDLVLVKASRAARLEVVAQALVSAEGNA